MLLGENWDMDWFAEEGEMEMEMEIEGDEFWEDWMMYGEGAGAGETILEEGEGFVDDGEVVDLTQE